jgi:hypothetical protein
MNKYLASRNLGFVTGPLLLIMGLISLDGQRVPKTFAYLFVVMGIIRIGITIYSYIQSKKKDN